MVILVDYENVRSSGMSGAKYLSAEDTLMIFYNGACRSMKREYLRKIKESGCKVELCQLPTA